MDYECNDYMEEWNFENELGISDCADEEYGREVVNGFVWKRISRIL